MADQVGRIVVGPELTKRLDEWRRIQPDLPNRSEAARRLMEMSLKQESAAEAR